MNIKDTVLNYYNINESTANNSIIKCPEKLPAIKKNWYVFLAGPIQGAPKWQFEMPTINNVTWISPRRQSYDQFDYKEQTTWETNCMRAADVILFWIPEREEIIEGRDYAQTTRTEFGEYLAMGKKVIVGVHKGFGGRRYFETKMEQYGMGSVHDSVEDAISELKSYIAECDNNQQTYVISDTHFSSERTLMLSKRPFKNANDMDWRMITNWNSVVHPNDIVYHLGDFGDTWPLQYLNGVKHLISGNYEKEGVITSDAEREAKYVGAGFDKYLNDAVIEYKGYHYVLAHEPLKCWTLRNKLEAENPDNKYFCIFGHIHGRQFIKKFGIDAGVDAHHFRPISMDEVDFYRNAIDKGYYDEEVWS